MSCDQIVEHINRLNEGCDCMYHLFQDSESEFLQMQFIYVFCGYSHNKQHHQWIGLCNEDIIFSVRYGVNF